MLTIGYTSCFIHEHKADFLIVKTIRIEIASANSTQSDRLVHPSRNAGEKVFDKDNGEVVLDSSPQSIINKYDWDKKVAYAVMRAESNENPKAYNENTNGSWDAGLFQINSIHGYSREEMENPEKNIEAAYQIYLKAGRKFTPWVVFNSKQYLHEL